MDEAGREVVPSIGASLHLSQDWGQILGPYETHQLSVTRGSQRAWDGHSATVSKAKTHELQSLPSASPHSGLLLLESVESCVRLEEAQERQWATMGSKKTEESQQVGEVE